MIPRVVSLTILLFFGYFSANSQVKAISDSTLKTGWYYIIDTDNGYKRQLDQDTTFYFINPTPIITAKNITILEIYKANYGEMGLSMKLDDSGTKFWSEATYRTIGKQLAFIFDNKLLHVPKVNSQITGGITALNRGIYLIQELETIKAAIEKEKQ